MLLSSQKRWPDRVDPDSVDPQKVAPKNVVYGIFMAASGLSGLTKHPTGAADMLLSQNEELSDLFNSRWVS